MATGLTRVVRRLWYAIAAIIIVAGILVSVSRLMTPWLNDQLPDFEAWATNLLHAPVKIGHVEISWSGYEPELSFTNVTVIDSKTQKPKFAVRELVINFSVWHSLTSWKPVLQSIRVVGVHLTIHKPTSGKFLIKEFSNLGITDNSTGAPTNFNEILLWLFAQPSLILEDIDIDYQLASQATQSVTIEQLILKNDASNHQLTGEAVLNQDIPLTGKINLTWTGTVLDFSQIPKNLTAHLYLYLEGVSLPQWLGQFSWRDLQIKEGLGSAKIWAEWSDSDLQKVQSQFQFYNFQIESLSTQQTEEIVRLSGHIGWRREGEKQIFAGNDILIDLPEHLWPTTNFTVVTTQAADGSYVINSARAGYLDLHDTKELILASGLVPTETEKQVTAIDPKGEVRGLFVNVPNGSFSDLMNLTLEGQFSGLSFNSWQNLPAVSNATGIFSWNGNQGNLKLDSHQFSVAFKLFPKPLRFDQVVASANWEKEKDNSWAVHLNNFQLLNTDLDAHGAMGLTIPEKDSPTINLSAFFNLFKANNISNYVPATGMEPDLVTWLTNAFSSGKIEAGKVIMQGRLADFPFTNKNGTFLVSGLLKDFDLNYAPKWPALRHMNGRLTFSGSSMTVDVELGQLMEGKVTNLHAIIPYIGALGPQILHVQGLIQTDMSEALSFIRNSPLQNTIGKDMEGMKLRGPMQLNLGLVVPLRHPDKTEVKGDATFNNVNLDLALWDLSIDKLKGALHFSEQDLQATNLQGEVMGQPALLNLATQNPKGKAAYLKATLQSTLSIPAVEKWLKISISQYVQGSSPFQAELHLAHAQSEASQINIKSDLKGIAVDLPSPFGKQAADASDLEFNITLKPKQPIFAEVHYDKSISAAVNFKSTDQGLQFDRGQLLIGAGKASIPPQPGLEVVAQFKKLTWEILDPYVKWFQEQLKKIQATETNENETTSTLSDVFRQVTVKADSAEFLGQQLGNAEVRVSKPNNDWLININSAQIAGMVTVPVSFTSVQGKFQRIHLAKTSGKGGGKIVDPKTLPAITLSAHDVRYDDMYLGNIYIQTTPSANGMQIKQLQATTDAMNLQATGSWRGDTKESTTRLQGRLNSPNVSQMLTQLGLNGSSITGSSGNVQFDLTWPDAPYNVAMGILSGSLRIQVGAGSIINLSKSTESKIGLGHLFNLLNLQSISSLTDLFQKGYSYNSMKADFRLQKGEAFTNNLYIDGKIASVALTGRIGLREKDYNLLIRITAYVSTGLPVAAAVVSAFNPIVGVAAWVADKVISSQVNKVTTYHYHITGSWENPVWTPVK